MSDNIKIALIGGTVSIIVAIFTTISTIEFQKKPIVLQGNGSVGAFGKDLSEINKADKRFYNANCSIGDVSHAVLNTESESDIIPQPALCACAEHPNATGDRVGWLCFD